jgi:cytochrome c-type biogenesis protein CcmH/NrfG
MEYILITTVLIIVILGFVIYNLMSKTEKLEKLVDDQNIYIDRISELIELSNKKIGESEIANAFKTDDEIGFFFETLQEIQSQLNSFKTRK